MEQRNIKEILRKYRLGEPLNEDEKIVLDNYYLHIANQPHSKLSDDALYYNLTKVESNIFNEISQSRVKKYRLWWYSTAAAVLLVASVSTLVYKFQSNASYQNEQRAQFEAINAGSDKVMLVLANGEEFEIDSDHSVMNSLDDITIDGEKIDLGKRGLSSASLNTLKIPKGGQFKITLSDGSQVWMNAESQLRYPTNFSGASREVELIGEAYFEIKHNAKMPFKVHTKDQHVQVLGTGFNISSYPNAATNTTLSHGKVRVDTETQQRTASMILSPGEQAITKAGTLLKQNADVAQVLAWKNGLFRFKKSSVEDITRELERWYDVKFVFQNKTIPMRQITGEIQRKVNLYEIVEILSYFDINCKIDGQTVYLDIKK
ncbi:FecR family protein [Sphingobacterium nematocida]|uniref:FecR family protein n=1 Tax=Sphingobacterium nematocida TaxID=1513896 RepID=A0A1T5GSH3_9SPHI|nr:FecR family protein [Sphingobacterium nematocida]SKC11357.1 FecR family protein [Sphingobacterium nematocida]